MNPKKLKAIRERIGLNTKQMADALQMSLRTYQGWEGGRTIPPIAATAVQLMEYMPAKTLNAWLSTHISEH